MTTVVNAFYGPEMDGKREQRIRAAFERCDVRFGEWPTGRVDDEDGEFPVHISDVEWLSDDDHTDTQLRIYVGDDRDRAARLASELRACGMVTSIEEEAGD